MRTNTRILYSIKLREILLALVPFALWGLVWAGVGGGDFRAVVHPSSSIGFTRAVLALLPLAAAVAAVASMLIGLRRQGFDVRFLFGPLGLTALYGLVGFISILYSPDREEALYRTALYLSVPLVLWAIIWKRDSLGQLTRLTNATWALIIGIVAALFSYSVLYMDLGDVITSPAGFLKCQTAGHWYTETSGQLRATGVGRYAAIAAILALGGLTHNRLRWAWGGILLVSLMLLITTHARTSMVGLGAAVLLIGLLYGGKRAFMVFSVAAGLFALVHFATDIDDDFWKQCFASASRSSTAAPAALATTTPDTLATVAVSPDASGAVPGIQREPSMPAPTGTAEPPAVSAGTAEPPAETTGTAEPPAETAGTAEPPAETARTAPQATQSKQADSSAADPAGQEQEAGGASILPSPAETVSPVNPIPAPSQVGPDDADGVLTTDSQHIGAGDVTVAISPPDGAEPVGASEGLQQSQPAPTQTARVIASPAQTQPDAAATDAVGTQPSPSIPAPAADDTAASPVVNRDPEVTTPAPVPPEIKPVLRRGLFHFTGRQDVWMIGIDLLKNSPLLGYGFHADRLMLKAHIHNAYLHATLQTGLLGLAPFVAALAYGWLLLWRSTRNLSQLSGERKRLMMQVGGLLAYFSIRSIPESSGAFFGVDWLLIALLLLVLQVVTSDNVASSPSGNGPAAAAPGSSSASTSLPGQRSWIQAGLARLPAMRTLRRSI